MIDDNKRLRKRYENNGFINIGYKNYDGAPFTVGKVVVHYKHNVKIDGFCPWKRRTTSGLAK